MSYSIPDFDPHANRAFFFTRLGLRRTLIWFLAISVPAVAIVVISLMASGLDSTTIFAIWLADARHFLGIPPPPTSDPAIGDGIGWPPWRDVVSFVIILTMAWTPLNGALQHRGMERILTHMQRAGAIKVTSQADADEIRTIVETANRRIGGRWQWLQVPVLLLWVAVCIVVFLQLKAGYAVAGGAWGLGETPILAVLFVGVCAVGLTNSTLRDVIALHIIGALRQILHRNLVSVGADLTNVDGRWGWAPIGEALRAAYRDIAVHLVPLVLITLAIPHNDPAWVLNIVALLFTMITAPIWFIEPLRMVIPQMRRFRKAVRATLVDPKRGTRDYSLTIAARADRLNAITDVPFVRGWGLAAAALGQIVNFFTLFTLIGGGVAVLLGTDSGTP